MELAMTPAEALAQLRDDELLALVVRRQEEALGALYDRYGRLVYAIALRITGDRQTTEEVVQDVFQNVWQSAAGFQAGVGSVSSWLMSIARHRAIDATRSRRERARMREQELTPEMPLVAEGPGPEDEVVQRLLREQVQTALRELPPGQRQAIELAYYGGLTRVEIAESLGEPVGTVKTRLRLGLLKLKNLLGDL
ncbi:MAG: sigma-70 family RNA polymerase sigma factor [Roseiflexaceae bacterium]|nr:sigma-70 family RNA polymerase sigma factor [Roseiflexaceae bacterium]